jgi:N-acetylglucosaminyldiphosphoundecaprenol N-acetyl-beta-D-mannosaminyltransferase
MTSFGYTNVLGVKVSAINMGIAVDTIDGWIKNRRKNYVTVTGVHGVMECQRDASLRDIHNRAGMVTPDGMPLVWLNKAKGFNHVERVYGPDLMLAVCAKSEVEGYRHFFYGGASDVPELLASKLRQRFPKLEIAGTYSPPFRPLTADERNEIAQQINSTKPDIVWVGLSTPKQERWMSEFSHQLDAPVLIGVGAAFDFHAGLKPQAPYWMQRSGLEWSFRLMAEPRRLWKRYLVNNPTFIVLVTLQMLGLRRYELPDEVSALVLTENE